MTWIDAWINGRRAEMARAGLAAAVAASSSKSRRRVQCPAGDHTHPVWTRGPDGRRRSWVVAARACARAKAARLAAIRAWRPR